MLPPLPLIPLPTGTPHPLTVLPLPVAPRGERAAFPPAPVPAAPQGVVQLPGGETPTTAPLLPLSAEPLPENIPRPQGAPAQLALPDAPPPTAPGTGAAAMALVAAQMQAGGTAAMQVVLAQQAAIRALPGAERPHSLPQEAAAPEDMADHPLTLALPPAQTETQERHVPGQVHGSAPRGKNPAQSEEEITAAIARRFPPVAPPVSPLPGPGTLWLLAGALFTALFLLVVLSL